MKEIKYIYEDADLLVCHKPAGVATEGARTYNMDVISAARNYIGRQNRGKEGLRKPPYVATVHRLDQPVEGVLVLAKTKKAATDIAAQIKNRTTDKYYYALCYGSFTEKKARLENYLIRREDGFAAVVEEDKSNPLVKKAVLDYEVIAENDNASLLRVKLLTGRFHQIRVQMSNIGHPIIGDQRYASDESKEYSEKNMVKDVCLVSYKFALKHPSTGKRVEFEIMPDNPQIREMLENT